MNIYYFQYVYNNEPVSKSSKTGSYHYFSVLRRLSCHVAVAYQTILNGPDFTLRNRRTFLMTTFAALSISVAVLNRPMPKRKVDWACFGVRPMAASTWLMPPDPELQADAPDRAISFCRSAIKAPPSTPSMVIFKLPQARFFGQPLISMSFSEAFNFCHNCLRSAPMRAFSCARFSLIKTHASPMPTIRW